MTSKMRLTKNGDAKRFVEEKSMTSVSSFYVPVEQIVLPGVSLATIVRDELMNPAGGVEDFIRSTVPYVREAIVVDTGSIDGTREKLEELQSEFPQLKVYDRDFRGFADARNFSLSKVSQPHVLVLDADERITRHGFSVLRDEVRQRFFSAVNFRFIEIRPSGEIKPGIGHNPRLFSSDERFDGVVGEVLSRSPDFCMKYGSVTIYHFVPDENGLVKKEVRFYEKFQDILAGGFAPSQIPGFNEWKQPHPQDVRERYR